MQILFLGLGKMGQNMALKLQKKGHDVLCWNRSEVRRQEAANAGLKIFNTLEEIFSKAEAPKTVWLMVSSDAVDEMLSEIKPFLKADDIVIDGGNSLFEKTIARNKQLAEEKINYIDAGVSGGPYAEERKGGWCIMTGGEAEVVKKIESIFTDLVCEKGYLYVGKSGAGHFTKMIHNAIEYGMMQSIAEGFELMKNEELTANSLAEIAQLYNSGSVIESRLVGWLADAYHKSGNELSEFDSTVAQNGEGKWALEYAKKKGTEVPAIECSVEFRNKSAEKKSYAGKVLSALRNSFGGHDTFNKNK